MKRIMQKLIWIGLLPGLASAFSPAELEGVWKIYRDGKPLPVEITLIEKEGSLQVSSYVVTSRNRSRPVLSSEFSGVDELVFVLENAVGPSGKPPPSPTSTMTIKFISPDLGYKWSACKGYDCVDKGKQNEVRRMR